VGSTKSNIGHIEPVSGLCSIIKSIFALETGIIAPNVNFTKLKPSIGQKFFKFPMSWHDF
jgi:fatty acid synthase